MDTAQSPTTPPTLDAAGLAAILHCSVQTVTSNAHRAPDRLPPQIRTGGRRLIWLTTDVLAWLEARRAGPAPTSPVAPVASSAAVAPRRRGRPTKAEQLARSAAGRGR